MHLDYKNLGLKGEEKIDFLRNNFSKLICKEFLLMAFLTT